MRPGRPGKGPKLIFLVEYLCELMDCNMNTARPQQWIMMGMIQEKVWEHGKNQNLNLYESYFLLDGFCFHLYYFSQSLICFWLTNQKIFLIQFARVMHAGATDVYYGDNLGDCGTTEFPMGIYQVTDVQMFPIGSKSMCIH